MKLIDEEELETLQEIVYNAEGRRYAETEGNFGDAREWDRHLMNSLDKLDGLTGWREE